MAKTRQEKQQTIEEYEEKLKGTTALIIIMPNGITPNEANALRKELSPKQSSLSVVQNRLFALALKKAGKELKDVKFENENAVIFCKGEITESAKAICEFIVKSEKGEIRGGLLGAKFITKEEIEEIAKLPAKEVLLSQVVGSFAAPISGFINVLNGNIVNFINILKNISETK